MLRRLTLALLGVIAVNGSLDAQILDHTMVPRGHLRLQAHPHFTDWHTRYGRLPDGTRQKEALGDDLTDPTSLSLFPGIATLTSVVRSMTPATTYTPVLGSTNGRITQDVTQIDFGGDFGVFDWLTVGVVVPWVQTRTAVDHFFAPDTINGDLGLNPTVSDRAAVDAFLAGLSTAESASAADAVAACSGGASPACTAAQALADRAAGLASAMDAAYGASPFFPLAGSAVATDLEALATALDADLIAAGLGGVGAPMVFAASRVLADEFGQLAAISGAGIQATFPLQTYRSLWSVGDVELSGRVRLLDSRSEPSEPPAGIGYLLTASFTTRLPTGLTEDPDILLDIGKGDGQLDLEGGFNATLSVGGWLSLAAGARYGMQREGTVTKRVAPPELVMPAASTTRSLTFQPGDYLRFEASPRLHVHPQLTLAGEYRYFQKDRDVFELSTPDPSIDPLVLSLESGIKAHQVGAGLYFDSTGPWMRGEPGRPMQLHIRMLHTVTGSGGQTPVSTRVEAGIRLFRRFFGPRYGG